MWTEVKTIRHYTEVYAYTLSVPAVSSSAGFNVETVLQIVADRMMLDKEVVRQDKSRDGDAVMYRHICWKLLREFWYKKSYKKLGEVFGDYDHTTVLSGIKSIENRMLTDERLTGIYQALRNYFTVYYSEQNEGNDI